MFRRARKTPIEGMNPKQLGREGKMLRSFVEGHDRRLRRARAYNKSAAERNRRVRAVGMETREAEARLREVERMHAELRKVRSGLKT